MRKKILSVIIQVFISTICFAQQTWTNPHILPDEYPLYGIGDPQILKYNGIFYLYASTRDSETGVKVWSSKTLTDWHYEGLCATDAVLKAAYAPEVIFWGDKFYMYTSPAGRGHYIFEGNSPTGPFTRVTNNLGHSIDGSVFKDDDGSLTFYHSGDDGIHTHTMNSPTDINADIVLASSRMNGWTEGPYTIKRNGVYYMIYTGNHVLNPSYRIDFGTSTVSPTGPFIPETDQNPVLLNTEGDFYGLGHGATLIGPDLDSYYITYHNKAGDFGVGPYRQLNFDRIVFNGNKMNVLGATNTPQRIPDMPDFYEYFDANSLPAGWEYSGNANWKATTYLAYEAGVPDERYSAISNFSPQENFTLEANVRTSHSGAFAIMGTIFNYSDENNYGIALLHTQSNELEVRFIKNGVWENPQMTSLPGVNNYANFHTIRVEKLHDSYTFFVDGMKKFETTDTLPIGRVGYLSYGTAVHYGALAVSNKVQGNSAFDAYKPIPGTIAAVHYNSDLAANVDNTTGNSYKLYRNEDVDIVEATIGGYAVEASAGESLTYNAMIATDGAYCISIRYKSTDAAQLAFSENDDELGGSVTLPSTDGEWNTVTIPNIQLAKGANTIRVNIIAGTATIYSFACNYYKALDPNIADDFNAGYNGLWNFSDGAWLASNGTATINGTGKRTMGNTGYTDYRVQTDIKYSEGMNGGLIFRVQNPASGGLGNDANAGGDFYQGYYFTLNPTGCTLGKQNYNWQELATAPGSFKLNTWYTIAVELSGNTIRLYVNDLSTPILEYTDPMPFKTGKAGLRSYYSNIAFDNFSITSPQLPLGNGTGLSANYYSGLKFDEKILSRTDETIAFNWQAGSPDPVMPADTFSVKWNGEILAPVTGNYTFTIVSDNGRQLWINNELIIDKWVNDWDIPYSGTIYLEAGEKYPISLNYFETSGGANITFYWTPPGVSQQIISKDYFYPASEITISLEAGWNLVSVPVTPTDESIRSVFPNAAAVKTMDYFWNNSQPQFLNTLNAIEAGVGYLVYNEIAETIHISGTATAIDQKLKLGWNLIGSTSISIRSLESAFGAELEDIRLIKNFDYFWEQGNTTNTLNKIEPGTAYFLLK